jgi:hypothetical protein
MKDVIAVISVDLELSSLPEKIEDTRGTFEGCSVRLAREVSQGRIMCGMVPEATMDFEMLCIHINSHAWPCNSMRGQIVCDSPISASRCETRLLCPERSSEAPATKTNGNRKRKKMKGEKKLKN